jgi:hypothetical protein
VLKREQAMPIYLGNGLAVPLGRLDGIERPILAFARSDEGVRLETTNERAELVFLLLTPSGVKTSRMNTSTVNEARAVIRRTRRELLITVCLESSRGAGRAYTSDCHPPAKHQHYPSEHAPTGSDAVMSGQEGMSGIYGRRPQRGSPQVMAVRPG